MNLTSKKNNSAGKIVSFLLALSTMILVLPIADAKLHSPATSAGPDLANDGEDSASFVPNTKTIKKRMTEEDHNNDYLTAFLESEQCSSFMEGVNQTVASLLEFSHDEIIEYSCNAVHRAELATTGEAIQDDLANHKEGTLTCKLAYEMKYFADDGLEALMAVTDSYEACVEEMTNELEIFKEQDSSRRALVAGVPPIEVLAAGTTNRDLAQHLAWCRFCNCSGCGPWFRCRIVILMSAETLTKNRY